MAPPQAHAEDPLLCLAYWLNSQGQGRSQRRGQAGWEDCRSTASWGEVRGQTQTGWAGPDSRSHTDCSCQVEGGQRIGWEPSITALAPAHKGCAWRVVCALGPPRPRRQRSPVKLHWGKLGHRTPCWSPETAQGAHQREVDSAHSDCARCLIPAWIPGRDRKKEEKQETMRQSASKGLYTCTWAYSALTSTRGRKNFPCKGHLSKTPGRKVSKIVKVIRKV